MAGQPPRLISTPRACRFAARAPTKSPAASRNWRRSRPRRAPRADARRRHPGVTRFSSRRHRLRGLQRHHPQEDRRHQQRDPLLCLLARARRIDPAPITTVATSLGAKTPNSAAMPAAPATSHCCAPPSSAPCCARAPSICPPSPSATPPILPPLCASSTLLTHDFEVLPESRGRFCPPTQRPVPKASLSSIK